MNTTRSRRNAVVGTIIGIIALGAVLWFADPARSAIYVVKPGDSWERIANRVSFPGLRYNANTLQLLNPDISMLKPGQEVIYLSQIEIAYAKEWVQLCIDAGYKDKTYMDDYRKLFSLRIMKPVLSDLKIDKSAMIRYINYAEARVKCGHPVLAASLR